MMKNPRLRSDLQLITTTVEGHEVLAFIDPLHMTENALTLNRSVLPILQLLDGTNDFRDLQLEIMRSREGGLAPLSEIEEFVGRLDEFFLLDSDTFRERMRFLYEEFEKGEDRYPFHAGNSYDADPAKLSRFIKDAEDELPRKGPDFTGRSIAGILAPHIDVAVAKSSYVSLYRHLKGREYEIAVILGVNHQWQDGLYSVTEKNYVTPFGTLKAARDVVSELKARVPSGTLATNDFGHKMEHSIEFQTLFLSYFLKSSVPIVPILCGSIHEFIMEERSIFDDERFKGMVGALESLIGKREGDVLLVSGVDFSHVGLKFDDPLPANVLLPDARENDEKILSCLLEGQPEKIYENALETKNRFNVCGLPSMLVFSTLLKGSQAEILSHETYDEEATRSAVTYASMIFTDD
ncbi:MAG: AmmeMemoRadiSam system protein B [Thermodesulfobacteriota bacterium]|nr:AmmeMemoRadiSam system protein B [Thermodesulfobacteriota bacterium]